MTIILAERDSPEVSLEKLACCRIWLPVVASAALALGFFLGTWFASERQATPETPSAARHNRSVRLPMYRRGPFRSKVQSITEVRPANEVVVPKRHEALQILRL
jgi:hypothetical protein